MIKKSFTKACMDHFGRRPNQTTAQFSEELKAAKVGGMDYWVREFAKIGVELDMVPTDKAA